MTQGPDVTAGVETMSGEEREQLGVRIDDDKAVIVLTGKGWKVAAEFTGSRYLPDD